MLTVIGKNISLAKSQKTKSVCSVYVWKLRSCSLLQVLFNCANSPQVNARQSLFFSFPFLSFGRISYRYQMNILENTFNSRGDRETFFSTIF